MHEPEVEIRRVELRERVLERRTNTAVVRVGELRREEDLAARDAGVLQPKSDFMLVR